MDRSTAVASSGSVEGLLVVIVDDEPALSEVVGLALEARGYRVAVCPTGGSALRKAASDPPDIVLLDLGLPDIDGIEVCRRLRRTLASPILVLSADGAEDRKVEALDAGADDYVTKPFSMPELLARIRVAVRHRRMLAVVMDSTVIEIGDLRLDTGSHGVTVGDRRLDLTRREFALLTALCRNVGKTLRHDAILALAWAPDAGSMESLRVHVTHLRQKLGAGPQVPRIVTEPGIGYRLVLDDSRHR